MIRKLQLQNFKCFESLSLELGKISLLSGLNGMGKSTVLQSLLLLRQSYLQQLLPNTGIAINGSIINLGTAQDVLYEGAIEGRTPDKIQGLTPLQAAREQLKNSLYAEGEKIKKALERAK